MCIHPTCRCESDCIPWSFRIWINGNCLNVSPNSHRCLNFWDTRKSKITSLCDCEADTPLHPRFYFPGILVGPYLEYTEYMDLISEAPFQGPEFKTKLGRKIPPGRKRVAYRKMFMGLLYLGLFVVFGGSFNFGVALAPWFLTKSFGYRCVNTGV
jgi:lysophospholipid acyltransferase